jgi:hypothetical protein
MQQLFFKMHLCPKLTFPPIREFSQEILLGLIEKRNQLHVFLAVVECHFTTTSFDLLVSIGV